MRKCKEAERQFGAKNMKELYNTIREVAGVGRRKVVSQVAAETWVQHFRRLFTQLHRSLGEGVKEQFSTLVTEDERKRIQDIAVDTAPTMEEVSDAIDAGALGKAAAEDGMVNELLRAAGKCARTRLWEVCTTVWNEEDWPKDWTTSVMTPVPKKQASSDPDKHRGVSLIAHPAKVLLKILQNRLNPLIEELIGEYQCGSRKHRGTVDAIFSYHLISEVLRGQGKQLATWFVDLTKAYDTVHWDLLFHCMEAAGFPQKLIRLVRLLYRLSTFKVRLHMEFLDREK